jgi:hypothetical protein
LFPHLRVLSIHLHKFDTFGPSSENNKEECRNIAPFVIPTLTRVNILGKYYGQGLDLVHSFLQNPTDACPTLRHIRIQGPMDFSILTDIAHFPNLEIFDSNFDTETMTSVREVIPPPMHVDMMQKLSTLNNLSTLLLPFHDSTPTPFSFAPSLQLSNLIRVAIKANQVATILSIMPHV